jgi:low affinity Fe/Cu permease
VTGTPTPPGRAARPDLSQAAFFDRFAEATSRFVSRGAFFATCLIVVVIWLPTIAIFSSVDTWQLVINTMTSVLAFLLIALLQNSERRYDEALHAKIDALAAAVAELIERDDEGPRGNEAAELGKRAEELRGTIGLERRV